MLPTTVIFNGNKHFDSFSICNDSLKHLFPVRGRKLIHGRKLDKYILMFETSFPHKGTEMFYRTSL